MCSWRATPKLGGVIAAVTCRRPGCPSDTSDYRDVWMLSENVYSGFVEKVIGGAIFRCKVCGLKWVQMRSMREPFIPPESYWVGNEFN